MEQNYYVYFLTNYSNKVLYIGMTHNLKSRILQHRHRLVDGFSKKYHLNKLVYFEHVDDYDAARARESELKGWRRCRKNILVNNINPHWHDLYIQL